MLKQTREISQQILASLAGLKLTLALLVMLVFLAMAGAWIPQEDSAYNQTLLAKYGTEGSALLKNSGLLNVYQSPIFIACNALLFINLLACTTLRMSPRIRARLKKTDYISASEIELLNESQTFEFEGNTEEALSELNREMKALGYQSFQRGNQLIFEKGKWGWLAAPLTHLGLFILMIGVTISALYSYSGKLFLLEGQEGKISEGLDRKPILGKYRNLGVKLISTRKESNSDGSPKQWFSCLRVEDEGEKNSRSGEISVNNPWSYNDIDFCQSDWKIAGVQVRLGENDLEVPFEDMGHDCMGLIPISDNLLMVLALKDSDSPLRLYFKHSQSNMPKLFDSLKKGESSRECPIPFKYNNALLRSGITFKCDPGLPVTYASFFVLFLGAIFVASPSLRLWAAAEALEKRSSIILGFNGIKAAQSMRRDLRHIERHFENIDEKTKKTEVMKVDS